MTGMSRLRDELILLVSIAVMFVGTAVVAGVWIALVYLVAVKALGPMA